MGKAVDPDHSRGAAHCEPDRDLVALLRERGSELRGYDWPRCSPDTVPGYVPPTKP